jgi:WD40 repeat protein
MRWKVPEEVGRLVFSPSGRLLATTRSLGDEENGVLRLWDAIRGREEARRGDLAPVFSLAFASESELVVVQQDRCLLWDADADRVRTLWTPTSGARLSAGTIVPELNLLVLVPASEPTQILLLDFPSGEVRRTLRTPATTEIWYDDLVATGPFLAAVCHENRPRYAIAAIWDVRRGKRLRTYDLPRGDTGGIALCPTGRGLAISTVDCIRAYDPDAEEELAGFTPFPCRTTLGLRYTSDGRELEVVSGNQLVRLDAASGNVLATFDIPSEIRGGYNSVLDPTGAKMARAADSEVEVLDLL